MPRVEREEILRLAKRADLHGQRSLADTLYKIGANITTSRFDLLSFKDRDNGIRLANQLLLTQEEIA